jgi:hypothetical protein
MSSQGALRDRVEAARAGRAALVAAVAAALIGGAVLAVVLLRGHSATGQALQGTSSAPSALAPASVVSPAFDGLALSAHGKDVLVGLGVHRGGPVDVVVVPSDETPVRPSDVRVRLGGRIVSGAASTACGSGCLRFPLHVLTGTPRTLAVEVDRAGKQSVRVPVRLPARMPGSAESLLGRARSKMLGLHALGMDETLGSGLSKTVVSSWSFQAPDRMRYSIVGGAKAVVIGTRRWDDFGTGWQRSASPRLQVPTFTWQNSRAARLLGTTTLGGTQVREVAAWLPARAGLAPTWFLLDLARDGRVLRSRMFTTAHFMIDRYRDFGAVEPIRPPR